MVLTVEAHDPVLLFGGGYSNLQSTSALLDKARALTRSLPRRIDLFIGGRRLAVIHGSSDRINEFVFGFNSDDDLQQLIRGAGCDGGIGGQCGLPFTRMVDGLMWHNPGAIEIRHPWLKYDHRAAAAAMRAGHLPQDYADALGSGLWHSLDVPPPQELARTGQALAPGTLHWPTAA